MKRTRVGILILTLCLLPFVSYAGKTDKAGVADDQPGPASYSSISVSDNKQSFEQQAQNVLTKTTDTILADYDKTKRESDMFLIKDHRSGLCGISKLVLSHFTLNLGDSPYTPFAFYSSRNNKGSWKDIYEINDKAYVDIKNNMIGKILDKIDDANIDIYCNAWDGSNKLTHNGDIVDFSIYNQCAKLWIMINPVSSDYDVNPSLSVVAKNYNYPKQEIQYFVEITIGVSQKVKILSSKMEKNLPTYMTKNIILLSPTDDWSSRIEGTLDKLIDKFIVEYKSAREDEKQENK